MIGLRAADRATPHWQRVGPHKTIFDEARIDPIGSRRGKGQPVGRQADTRTTAILLSGGLDSSILLAYLLEQGADVQPVYVQSQLVWQSAELAAVQQFLAAVRGPRLRSLVTLELPLADLYQGHWSLTGQDPPPADTPDEAVFLPGRNALLIMKPAVWCQLRDIPQLALATLGTNPFADTSPAFFAGLETALNAGAARPLTILRPLSQMTKRQVMRLITGCPLELTFSCIAPQNGLHCGRCNKCAVAPNCIPRCGSARPDPLLRSRQGKPVRPAPEHVTARISLMIPQARNG